MLVFNCCVTDTKDTLRASRASTIFAKSERLAQPINLADHYSVNLAGCDMIQQLLESGSAHVSAGVSSVITGRGNELPAFMSLTADKGCACLPLRVERIESIHSCRDFAAIRK